MFEEVKQRVKVFKLQYYHIFVRKSL